MINKKVKENLGIFNETKISILYALFECKDFLCGCDLVEKVDIPKNLLSYHLKSLRQLDLIEETRCGQKKQYKIKEDKKEKVLKILKVLEIIK